MFRKTIILAEDFIRKVMRFLLKMGLKKRDSFLSNHAVYTGKAPKDLSARHDDYLYGGHK